MYFLTRLTADPNHPSAVRALADTHALHRLVYKAFPAADDGAPGRPLYRVEPVQDARRGIVILVQSSAEPVHVERWRETGYLLVEGPKVVNPSFRTGQVLRFRLHANPTVRRWEYRKQRNGTRTEGKRVGLYTEEEQREWLDRKGKEGGFEVLQVKVSPQRAGGPTCVQDAIVRDQRVFGRKPGCHCHRFEGRDEPRELIHVAVTFDGFLRVTDPGVFRCTVDHGIGSGKAFGFGLLSLARSG